MSTDPRIDHVVVLMLENRSFDHMLGFLKAENPQIDGLVGTESNPEQCGVPNPRVTVNANASYRTRPDTPHTLSDVNVQLFCTSKPAANATQNNQGFVDAFTRRHGLSTGRHIMDCFPPSRLPALAALAREYAVCDRWFSSIPGPTWPNRAFVHCATSEGIAQNLLHVYGATTVYDRLESVGLDWRIYFHDIAIASNLNRLNIPRRIAKFRRIRRFYDDAAAGQLPAYSFIEPKYTINASDQHPPHDVRYGEQLIADIYYAIRNSPLWTRTLLVITYDEHGGLYDHVTPPRTVNPDGRYWPLAPGFNFDRLGVRVPAVLVSPYIPRGSVDHTVYEHSSVAATLRRLFNTGLPLTQRDAGAHAIDTSYWRTQPRIDTPISIPRPVVTSLASAAPSADPSISGINDDLTGATEPLSDLQESLVALAYMLTQPPAVFASLGTSPASTSPYDPATDSSSATADPTDATAFDVADVLGLGAGYPELTSLLGTMSTEAVAANYIESQVAQVYGPDGFEID